MNYVRCLSCVHFRQEIQVALVEASRKRVKNELRLIHGRCLYFNSPVTAANLESHVCVHHTNSAEYKPAPAVIEDKPRPTSPPTLRIVK